MFPLPLTPFEEYMLADDCVGYPMAGVFRIQLSGHLNRDAFESAARAAVERHPFLRATIERRRCCRPQWIDHPNWQPTIAWGAETNEYGYPEVTHLEITEEPATRVWVIERDGQTECRPEGYDVVFQVHHCSADAPGMSSFIHDILIAYAMNTGTPDLAMPRLKPERLLHRGMPGMTKWKLLRMAHKQAIGLQGAYQFLLRSPVAVLPCADRADRAIAPATFPAPRTVDLNTHETQGVIAAAKAHGVTVNDLLVRDLFLALDEWRTNAVGDNRDWLRLSIPVGLRTPADNTMPMSNSVSMVFLDRRGSDFDDPQKLLQGIHDEMELIKRNELQYTFLLSLGASRWMPGGISKGTQSHKCQSTSCISNLGPVFAKSPLPRRDGAIVSGNLTMEGIDFVIPLRPYLNAAFCVYTYAGRLRILMHFDPRTITNSQSIDFLQTFSEKVRKSIDVASYPQEPVTS